MNSDGYDVIVVGVGGMGSAAVAALAARGLSVLGLEQFVPGHTRGSSHGDSRIFRRAYFESPAYVPLLHRAYTLWDELPPDLGLHRVGCLNVGSASSPLLAGVEASAREHGVTVETLTDREVRRRFPAFGLRPDELAVFEADAGFVRPEATVRWYADRAVAHGATMITGVTVTDWSADHDRVEVVAGDRRWRGRRLILAAGAWTPGLAARLSLPIRIRRRVMHFFTPADPSLCAAPRLPTYLWELSPGDAIYGFPLDRGTVKIGFHHRGGPADPDQPQPAGSVAEIEQMRAVLAEHLPALAGPTGRSVGCLYALTPDEHFLLGRVPGTPDSVIVAAGFSGHGFKFVPVIGEILADLATDTDPGYDLGFLDPGRFPAGR